MTTATRETYQRAIDKARAEGLTQRVLDQGDGTYSVPGTAGTYTVTVFADDDIRCTCEAGKHQMAACKHRAATWMRRLGQLAAGHTPAPFAQRLQISESDDDGPTFADLFGIRAA